MYLAGTKPEHTINNGEKIGGAPSRKHIDATGEPSRNHIDATGEPPIYYGTLPVLYRH